MSNPRIFSSQGKVGGRIVIERLQSHLLKRNPLKDPADRDLPIYLPPSYDKSSNRYPVVICLSGFTGGAYNWFNYQPWMPAMDERMDLLIAGGMPEMILVFPDCFTRYGGSQYLDSPAVGNYRSYITKEVIPLVDRKLRTKKDRRYRGILGKSSGGYGAITLAMERPDLFSAVACHSGDMYFEYVYLPDFPAAFRSLEKFGGLGRVWKEFGQIPKTGKGDHSLINIIAMSACYSPDLKMKPHFFHLPFDEKTGKLKRDVWKRWKSKDPIEILKRKGNAFQDFGLVFLDCGSRDEFGLNLGARIFSAELKARHIPHEYEEFDGGHFNTQHRYDVSLRKLAEYFTTKT